MLRGASITSMWYAYVILAVMAVVVFTGATLRFRRDLAPGGKSHHEAAPSTPAGAGTRSGGAQ
jgi:ABC-2 type transport system permease protein